MKSRRKIWSLPLAMVTALLLVGLLGAVVLAVSKPVKNFQLDDQTITIEALAGSVTGIDLGMLSRRTESERPQSKTRSEPLTTRTMMMSLSTPR